MNFIKFFLVLIFIYLVNFNCAQILEDTIESKRLHNGNDIFRTGRAGFFAFKPFGENVNVGLNMLLPFVKFPTKRKLSENGRNEALLTVNTAAVTLGGLISGLGLFIAHILKSFMPLRGKEGEDVDIDVEESDAGTKSHSAERRQDFDVSGRRFRRLLEPFKFVYRNSSGARVDTSLTSLISIIEENFLENNIDLSACMQKSLCSIVQRANINMDKGVASGLEKMIDGLLQLNWMMQLTQKTAIEDAILAGRSNSTKQCLIKYATCKWETPQEQIFELIRKRVKFI